MIEREYIKEEQYEIRDKFQEEHIYVSIQSLRKYRERVGNHFKQRETFFVGVQCFLSKKWRHCWNYFAFTTNCVFEIGCLGMKKEDFTWCTSFHRHSPAYSCEFYWRNTGEEE